MQNIPNSNNTLTLQTYEAKVQEYIDDTPPINNELKSWLDKSLALKPQKSKVLEIGSGSGRDAKYIREKGYDLECSDAASSFLEFLREQGFHAKKLNILADELKGTYGLILANGVLLHFTTKETAHVLDKIHTALMVNGIFSFGIKQGDGETWTNSKLDAPRYFYFWQPDDLKSLLKEHGLEVLEIIESHTAHDQADWLHFITRKMMT